MAAGWSRATGRPAVVLVTSGPGVLNTTTPVAAAKLDEGPLVVLCGDVKASLAGRGSLQDGGPNGIDVVHVMQSVTKHAETVSSPSRAVAAVQHALAGKGPLVLEIPVRPDVRARNPRADVFAFPDSPAAK